MAFDTISVFDAIAGDDTSHQVTARKALALAHTRVENRLGAFLRGATTMDEFEARLAACQDDLAIYVAEASTEVGHDHPEHIARSLVDHYVHQRRWQPRTAEEVQQQQQQRGGQVPDTAAGAQHPDPWMDNEPGSLTFPQQWSRG